MARETTLSSAISGKDSGPRAVTRSGWRRSPERWRRGGSAPVYLLVREPDARAWRPHRGVQPTAGPVLSHGVFDAAPGGPLPPAAGVEGHLDRSKGRQVVRRGVSRPRAEDHQRRVGGLLIPCPRTAVPSRRRCNTSLIGGHWVESTGRRNTSIMEVCGAQEEQTERDSPVSGAYSFARATWHCVARGQSQVLGRHRSGLKTEDGGVEAGVSSPVAYRWFRHAGGVNPCLPQTVTGRYSSFAEREDIAIWRAQKLGVREIARRLGRHPSTISRELRRNASTRAYPPDYRASTAQWHAERRARRPKVAKLVTNDLLRDYVQERLSAVARTSDGRLIGPPGPKWNGKGKPHRADRRWVKAWSPEQISKRLRVDFPDDESMRISHEAIYQALFVQSRGALKRGWWPACAPGGPYGFHVHAPVRRPGATSARR